MLWQIGGPSPWQGITLRNVIYKQVRAGATTAWEKKAEELASSGASFVVRPFNKAAHWAFLEALRERHQLVVRFEALERAVYFDRTAPSFMTDP